MNLISANELFDTSEEFDINTDEAIIWVDALSSQADEAAMFNEVSSRGLYPPEDWEIFGRRSSEGDNTSASAALATKSRKVNDGIFDVTIEISNTLIEQRPNGVFCSKMLRRMLRKM